MHSLRFAHGLAAGLFLLATGALAQVPPTPTPTPAPAPYVTITYPRDGEVIGASTVSVFYTTNITPRVHNLYVNGEGIRRLYPVSTRLTWDTLRYHGTNTLVVQLVDAAGRAVTSAPIRVRTAHSTHQVLMAQAAWHMGSGALLGEVNRYAALLTLGGHRTLAIQNLMLNSIYRRERARRVIASVGMYPVTDVLVERVVSVLNNTAGSVEAAQVEVAGSDAFFLGVCQADNTRFVDLLLLATRGLYGTDNPRRSTWISMLNARYPRALVAAQILQREEARAERIRRAHFDYLRLNPPPTFAIQWGQLLRAGVTDDPLVATVVGSDAYLAKVLDHTFVSGTDLERSLGQ